MPELPEVETVLRTLQHQLGNCFIEDVEIIYPRIIANKSPQEFIDCLKGQQLVDYGRRGKFLLFTFTDYIMVTHLRMEGKFFYYKEESILNKHTHLVFKLDCGQLHYNDVRKFGRFYLYQKDEPLTCLEKLGKEPWDESLNGAYLKKFCHNNKTPLKTQLLNQEMIAGIGNIYADEICFATKNSPFVPCGLLSEEKWDEIIKATRDILGKAIEAGGSTIRSYTSSLGVTGLFQFALKVYGKNDGQQCEDCHTPIIKTKLAGRGCHYCPNCQKIKPTVIAITGTMGSGKSEVLKHLNNLGYKCISCDVINSQLLELEDVKNDLKKILNTDYIDKKVIADRIFSDLSMKKQVEDYLHNRIKMEIMRFIETNDQQDIIIVEVPLLFESHWDYFFDVNISLDCPEEILIKRLKEKRGYDQKEIERRLANQMSTKEKKQRADYVIINDGSLAKLQGNIEKLINNIVKLKVIER